MKKNVLFFLCIINIVCLLIAIFVENVPYGYFSIVRLIEFVSCVVVIINAVLKSSIGVLTLFLGLLGLVFNPIFKVSFSRDVWIIVDICATLLWGIFFLHYIMKKR